MFGGFLVSMMAGVAAALLLRAASERSDAPDVANEPAAPDLSGRVSSLERALTAIRLDSDDLKAGHASLESVLQRTQAEQTRATQALREWSEERFTQAEKKLAEAVTVRREADWDVRVRKLQVSPAGVPQHLEQRLQEHAAVIQQLQDRVVRLERSTRELATKLEQFRSEAGPAMAVARE